MLKLNDNVNNKLKVVEEIDEEELKRREQMRKEQGTRLQKQIAKQREEKVYII